MLQNCWETYGNVCEKQNEKMQCYFVNHCRKRNESYGCHIKNLQCTHTVACDLTYMNNIDIIIIRKCLQHFTDRGPDQFKGQSRYTSTPVTHQYKHNAVKGKVDKKIKINFQKSRIFGLTMLSSLNKSTQLQQSFNKWYVNIHHDNTYISLSIYIYMRHSIQD